MHAHFLELDVKRAEDRGAGESRIQQVNDGSLILRGGQEGKRKYDKIRCSFEDSERTSPLLALHLSGRRMSSADAAQPVEQPEVTKSYLFYHRDGAWEARTAASYPFTSPRAPSTSSPRRR